MTDFSSRAEAIRRLTEVELDAILLREVCHSRQNWQRDGDWHDWIEISPDERERLVAAAKSVARLTAQVETLQAERDEAREIVAKVNNEVIGSDNYFTHPSCVDEVRKLKAQATAEYQRANAAETQVTALRALLRAAYEKLCHTPLGDHPLGKQIREALDGPNGAMNDGAAWKDTP